MKRDMDYVRNLLVKIEAAPTAIENSSELLDPAATEQEVEKLSYHLGMLIDQVPFVSGISIGDDDGEAWVDLKLTWHGHEFLEKVRDPEVWSRTMAGAKKAGNFGLEFVGDLAKAYAKHIAKERLGIDF
ncbi:MAG: DUF2513 domain-containing protein [Pseudomonadota bacterium]